MRTPPVPALFPYTTLFRSSLREKLKWGSSLAHFGKRPWWAASKGAGVLRAEAVPAGRDPVKIRCPKFCVTRRSSGRLPPFQAVVVYNRNCFEEPWSLRPGAAELPIVRRLLEL